MRQRSASPLIAFALATMSPGAFAEDEKVDKDRLIRERYKEAREHYQKQDYGKANEVLVKVLELLPVPKDVAVEPNRARVHYEMGANYALLGKKKEAFESLGRAVDLGYWNHEYLSADPTLKALKEDKAEFGKLVERCKRGLGGMAFGLKDLKGKLIDRKDYEGKALIIDVWGTWCPPCRAEIPAFVRLHEKYADKGLRIIGLTWEKVPPDDAVRRRVEEFAAKQSMSYTVAMMPAEVLNSIPNMQGFPTTLYIAPDGTVVDRVVGMEEYRELEERVVKLLKRKP